MRSCGARKSNSYAAALTLAVLIAPVIGAALAALLRRRRVATSLAGGAAVILLVLTAGNLLEQTRPLEPDRANVVLITLDTTRADRIGCYGYRNARTPNLNRLAEAGAQFICDERRDLTALQAHSILLQL